MRIISFENENMQITSWATHDEVPSARSQQVVMLAANGRHLGPKPGLRIIVLSCLFCNFLGMFEFSFRFINDKLFKDCHDLRVAFGDHFAYLCLTFLEL